MNTEIKRVLEGVRDGEITVDDALLKIKQEPFTDLGYAMIDHHRKIAEFDREPLISYIEPAAAAASELVAEMLEQVLNAVNVPVIASGGAGGVKDFVELFTKLPTVDAGLAASIFHFGEVSIRDLKQAMKEHGIPARIE